MNDKQPDDHVPRDDQVSPQDANDQPAAGQQPLPPFERTPLSPEFIAWAMQDINLEEIEACLRELREGRGLELKDFLSELEQAVADGERTQR